MLPPEEVAALHKALTAAKGDRQAAAAALGLEEEELVLKLRESEELSIMWLGRSRVPTGIDAYDREKPAFDLLEPVDLGPGLSPRKEAVADALQQQESKLQKFDWEGLGVKSPETLRLMRQFESGVGRGVVRLLDAMVGGMGFCFAQVSARFAYAASKLEEPAVQADPAVYAFWHEIFISCAKEMKGFNKEATGAAHTRLLIADRAQKMQGAADKMRKPGWRRVTPAATDGKAADG